MDFLPIFSSSSLLIAGTDMICTHIFFHLAEETFMHAIIDCTKYDQERQCMKEELSKTGVQELSIKTLMNLPSGWSSRVFF